MTAELSFMLVGHTKFFFGLHKKRYRRSSVDTIVDIVRVVNESRITGHNKPQLIRDLDGKQYVEFYQWTSFLQQFFKPIPNILKFHSFTVNSTQPGVVSMKQNVSSEAMVVNVLKVDHQTILEAGMPELSHVKGLDPQRQWYLYEQIRPFCKTTLAADFTSPKPSCEKPGGQSHLKYSLRLTQQATIQIPKS